MSKQSMFDFEVVTSEAMPPGRIALVPTRAPRPEEMKSSVGEPPLLAVDFEKYLEGLARESVLLVNMAPAVDWRKCPHGNPKQPAGGLNFAAGHPCYIFCCSACFKKHEGCTDRCLVPRQVNE